MTQGGPAGVFDREHRRTTTGLLVLVTLVAFEVVAVATAVGTAMPTVVGELDGVGVLLLAPSPEHRRGADPASRQLAEVTAAPAEHRRDASTLASS